MGKQDDGNRDRDREPHLIFGSQSVKQRVDAFLIEHPEYESARDSLLTQGDVAFLLGVLYGAIGPTEFAALSLSLQDKLGTENAREQVTALVMRVEDLWSTVSNMKRGSA